MATTLEDIKNLVSTLTGSLQTRLDQLAAARDYANSAVSTLLANSLNIIKTNNQVTVYIHSVNGDDNNSGAIASPVKTWAGMIAKAEAGQRMEINLMSDVVADTLVLWKNPPSAMRFIGRGENGTGLAQRKIQFVDATNFNASYAGGLYSLSSMELDTLSIDYECAQTRSFSPIFVRAGRLELKAVNGTITRTGTGGPLFNVTGSAHFEVSNITIDPSASGNVITGISAGGDPNSRDGFTANFTQA